jgi:hypothetical protein
MNTRSQINLPIKHSLKSVYVLTLIISGLMTLASVIGVLFPSTIYPSDELATTFISNDVVNLLIGLPIILISLLLALKKNLLGLLFWPGALFYVFYNYLVYILAMPLNWGFLLHLTIITASVYTLIILAINIDGTKIQEQLSGLVYERVSGAILVAMGLLFILQSVGAMVEPIINPIQITEIDFAVHVADFLISPALVIGGILLWRRKEFGYVFGLGLLFQASMLFIGLIVFLIIQPLLNSTPFLLFDIFVIFIMGLVCFIPFGLFIRGIMTKDNSSS